MVVYKIDRLTRSLTDFAKLVEVFDQYGVSFVSVTQSFNTTTSMGRLTLNVLLSFAQFEREVIGERIRDKVAASKKKGMWMGGHPMLGYDIVDQKLIVNKEEAENIHYIFDRYLELKTIRRLQTDLETKGITSKTWTSRAGRLHVGKPYGYGALHHLLSNPVYAGCIGHRGDIHEGQHDAIIPKEKWQQVQNMLQDKAAVERGHKKQTMKNILKGKIFGVDGMIYTPIRTNRHGKHYRYYVRRDIVQGQASKTDLHARLPAHDIEKLVNDALVAELKDHDKAATLLRVDAIVYPVLLSEISYYVLENDLNLFDTIQKVTIHRDSVQIEIDLKVLRGCIETLVGQKIPMQIDSGIHNLAVPYHSMRGRKGATVVRIGNGSDPLDMPKSRLEGLVKGVIWRDEHFSGKSFRAIAREVNLDESSVRRLINECLSFR